MTGGWQDNQGYGGGWQPQQDPYGQPQQDPYAQQPQYGPPYDPYGQYQQQDAYQNYPGWGEPPPPKKSRLPIVLSIIAIVAIVGGVVAIVLLNRGDDPKPAANVGPSTSNRPATPSKVPPLGSNTKKPLSSGANPPALPDSNTVECADKKCTFQVPKDWKPSPEPKDSGLGVQFVDVNDSGTYECGGSKYFRGFTANATVQSKTSATLDPNKVATDFANGFATKYYGPSPKIDAPAPTSATVAGKKGATLTAKVTVTPTKPECEATAGEVAVLAVPVEQGGVRVFVVVNDLAGGPAEPKPLPDPLAEDMLQTLSLT